MDRSATSHKGQDTGLHRMPLSLSSPTYRESSQTVEKLGKEDSNGMKEGLRVWPGHSPPENGCETKSCIMGNKDSRQDGSAHHHGNCVELPLTELS